MFRQLTADGRASPGGRLCECPPEFSLFSGVHELQRNDPVSCYGWTLDPGRDYMLRSTQCARPLLTLQFCEV